LRNRAVGLRRLHGFFFFWRALLELPKEQSAQAHHEHGGHGADVPKTIVSGLLWRILEAFWAVGRYIY
jgi:hypothetical protein